VVVEVFSLAFAPAVVDLSLVFGADLPLAVVGFYLAFAVADLAPVGASLAFALAPVDAALALHASAVSLADAALLLGVVVAVLSFLVASLVLDVAARELDFLTVLRYVVFGAVADDLPFVVALTPYVAVGVFLNLAVVAVDAVLAVVFAPLVAALVLVVDSSMKG
jgi:hypothetical protein